MTAVEAAAPGLLDVDIFLAVVRAAGDDLEALAAAWPAITPDRLAFAVAESSGLSLDDDERLDLFALVREQLAEIDHRREVFSTLAPSVADAYFGLADRPTGLHLGAGAEKLPLLDLAGDVARREPTGKLSVHVAERPSPLGAGCFSRSKAGAIICLDEGLTTKRLAESWGHELAHAVDPHVVDPANAEAFANHLGPVLLELAPATVEEAAMAIARTLSAVRPHPRTVPSGSTVAALLDWALGQVLTESDLCPSIPTRQR